MKPDDAFQDQQSLRDESAPSKGRGLSARPVLRLSRPSPRFQQPPKAQLCRSERPQRLLSPEPIPMDAPAGWWEHVEAARELSGVPLAGLPASPQDALRPLVGMGLGGMAGARKAAGVAPTAALLTAKALRTYRKSAAYTAACLAPRAVVVDLLTGEDAGPVNEHQQAAAGGSTPPFKQVRDRSAPTPRPRDAHQRKTPLRIIP